ncbi:ribonuclease Z [Mammaliicoccus sciuri]|uniref:MBL fold metallo-hydrolase n=1 Tax=Mammaliicoccus sciuri TaxID=1296 RepID=UPI0019D3FD88|nr:MBL fold metallo-hydrolase [Mammaliicoccus sciuri]QSN68471.1 ribonuclease Z [Mammaliicoccus sciuri]UIU23212.1 MBL fold metallo-hydrolase [Mammaliicoccus sciuri]UIU26117.1 MBL fold metallo-hydrolase [Mammaliicoccus sciuri]
MGKFKLYPLGFGSAFNSHEYGNNSWFFVNKDELYIIDCGSTVFNTFKQKGLDEFENINIIITHMHTDHVGSLGTLIEYMYYVKEVRVKIISAYSLRNDIATYLGISGIERYMYEQILHKPDEFDIKLDNITIEFHETPHVPQLKSYSLAIVRDKEELIIYSGDTTSGFDEELFNIYLGFTHMEKLMLTGLYLDKSLNDNTVHAPAKRYRGFNYDRINRIFSDNNTDVVIMHLDDTIENYEKALGVFEGVNVTIGGEI